MSQSEGVKFTLARSLTWLQHGRRVFATAGTRGTVYGLSQELPKRFVPSPEEAPEVLLAVGLDAVYVTGAFIRSETALEFKIPRNLAAKGFKVKVFSTPQPYHYEPKTGTIKIDFTPSKKRLSVLEILYKENGIEYRANALINHKRDATVSTGKKDKKKKKKKNLKRED